MILDGYIDAHGLVLGLAGTITAEKDSLDANEELAKALIQKAKDKAIAVKPLLRYPEYIGPPNPQVLLVGDKRNDKTVTLLPFMPVDSNSGDYLLKNLPEDFWRSVGIINVDDIGGKRLDSLWIALGKPRIVALGRLAERGLKAAGFIDAQFNVVAHPQYVRRFHHHDGALYGSAIKRLSNLEQQLVKADDPWILR
jgi:hypothetical protein